MKILLVDDDPKIVEMLRHALHKERFSVECAYDGETAFGKAKHCKYDVIVLDIMLPGKSGYDILAGLRVLGIDTPILVISARTMVEDRVKGLDMGADDYLVKNFSIKEFIARVKSLLRRRSPKRKNFIQCGDITINMLNMQVLHRGVPLALTPKEFGILVELVKRKNSVVSRKELIESIWEEDESNFSSNTIEAHIKALRKKLKDPESIKTIRGFGYSLVDKSGVFGSVE